MNKLILIIQILSLVLYIVCLIYNTIKSTYDLKQKYKIEPHDEIKLNI